MTDPTTRARLREIADDPAWSPTLRAEAQRAADDGDLPIPVPDDDAIRAALVRRIGRRTEPGRPDDPERIRARGERP